MRKRTVIILTLALLLLVVPVYGKNATRSSQGLIIDEKKIEIIPYHIEGNNYFMLRDLANVLNDTPAKFSVDYDDENREVLIERDKDYSYDGEINIPLEKAETNLSTQQVKIDGIKVDLEGYNIAGHNYFKLRDLGKALDFFVDYDSKTRTIIVDTSNGYVDNEPEKKPEPKKEVTVDTEVFTPEDDWMVAYMNPKGQEITFGGEGGLLVNIVDDVVVSAKNVSGKTKMPSKGYVIYHPKAIVADNKEFFVKGNVVSILLTSPSIYSPTSVRKDMSEKMVYAISVVGDDFMELLPDEIIDEFSQPGSGYDLHLADPKTVFKRINEGGLSAHSYWVMQEFGSLENRKEAMIAYALAGLGSPYHQVDCSRMVYSAMMMSGIDPGVFPFYTVFIHQSTNLKEIPISDLKRGDILNYHDGESGHVMIYLGNNKVVESLPKKGVSVNPLRTKGYTAYRIIE